MISGREAGTYVLVLHLPEETELTIGRLGRFRFPVGYYAYVGSALNGLAARIARHLRDEKQPHWHVDYLRAKARVVAIYAEPGGDKRECEVAGRLASLTGAVPFAGFGSSDCRCRSHLVWLAQPPTPEDLSPRFRPWPLAGE